MNIPKFEFISSPLKRQKKNASKMSFAEAPRINGFSELSQVMSRSVTACKHAGCWNQLISWNVCKMTGVKFLKSVRSKNSVF